MWYKDELAYAKASEGVRRVSHRRRLEEKVMKRREFVEKLGVGSAGLAAAAAFSERTSAAGQHDHQQVNGPLASATVSFGEWKTDPPIDRLLPTPPVTNAHLLIPYVAKIKAGGSINFIISGLHHVLIYGPGTTMESIDSTTTIPSGTGFPPLVDDATNRIYRGLNPAALIPVLDRVEVVRIVHPGRYLVVCGVLPHFEDNMHGWVEVLP